MTGRKPKHDSVHVGDVISAMEIIAPPQLAEEWDNCGLQIGSRQWPVGRIWVALDPSPVVIQAAAQQQVDMIVTHHPLLFRPLHQIDVDSPLGGILHTALSAQMAIYAAHTNLDSALGGVNDTLSRLVGLVDTVPMIPAGTSDNGFCDFGMGRIGSLENPISLEQLALSLKSQLNLAVVKYSGDPRAMIRRVAVCSGAGSSLLDIFLNSDAQVYVSGDLRYHDARAIEEVGRGLIDVGHFPSEKIITDVLVDQLNYHARRAGWSMIIEPCRIEQDVFRFL
jgi:dinuclear metal center YbgI/SA1388 family protein